MKVAASAASAAFGHCAKCGLDYLPPTNPCPLCSVPPVHDDDRPGGIIRPSGPRDSQGRYLHVDGALVGEAGGETEHRRGRPFCGKSGDVMTAYLRAAGVPRGELFITNIYPYWPGPGNPDPTEGQIKEAEKILIADLRAVKPRVIGAVGRIAARWFLGDVDMETCHGIPHYSDKAPGATVVPTYHPAAGFYEPEVAAHCQDDFLRFAHYLHNPVEVRRVPTIRHVLVGTAPEWIEDAYVDTEGVPDAPRMISWSFDGRTAYVWYYAPGKRAPKLRGRITMHNAPFDLKNLRAMGIDTRWIDVHDTMVKLFNLQLEPQGLKPASYRHLGLKMTTFDETVRPHFDRLAVKWLKKAGKATDYPKPELIPVADYTKKKWRLYGQWDAGRKIRSVLTAYAKDVASVAAGVLPDKPVKLEKRWEELGLSDWTDRTAEFQEQATAHVGRPFPPFSVDVLPKKVAVAYSGTDAAATCLIDKPVDALIEARGLRDVYEMDRRALRFVDRMQEVGMRVDRRRLWEFEADLETVRDEARRKVQRIAGNRWFNPGSSQQVAAWLYGFRGLPVLTYTDTGQGSTSDAALQMLRGYHAQDPEVAGFLTGIQDYREADKYLGTHLALIFKSLKRDAVGDWRVYADFRTTRVVSGRLSSWLLTIPVRTSLGRRFRHCFVAREGWTIIDADLSQLELRIGAHYSRDRTMREAFEQDRDLHALTASIIFKVLLEAIGKDSSERYVAKTINFAVFYGISARALLEQLYKAGIFDYTYEDCEGFIAEWFKIYASVRDFQRRLWRQAESDGFVRTMFGRICYVPNLRVVDDKLREAAQRLAANFPVQGTGSDVTKRAEIRVHDVLEETGLRDECWPWLQMHDELVLETRKERVDDVKQLVEAAMVADQRRFSVPIKAEAKTGASWGEAKG